VTHGINAPKITALAPWFGSKRTLAPIIVEELGPHRDYWEPFCGSMAVLLAKPRATNETINDLHEDLINLARVVQAPDLAPKLYRRLRRTLFCEGWHKECQAALKAKPADPLEWAYLYFVTTWMSMSGIAGTQRATSKLCIRYTSTGGNPTVRFRNASASIPAWMERLRAVRILNRDGFKVLAGIPDVAGTVIYCDPPYIAKSSAYKHDFASADHARLAEALGRFKATRVVVSYYEHPSLDALYPGWTKRHLIARKALVCQSARDMKGVEAVAPEVLLINGPSLNPSAVELARDEAFPDPEPLTGLFEAQEPTP
jgi:DNA adenine methylase